MKFPWPGRALLERQLGYVTNQLGGAEATIRDERRTLEEFKKRAAELETERPYLLQREADAKGALALLRTYAKAMETRLKDLDEPPISSEDLAATLKRMSFLSSQNDALLAQNERLATHVQELTDKFMKKEVV